ncbi:MAG: Glu/Leu/Phe/Val dehydrogenase [Deltaproteobacteria bacterium]|nr:Glu/Leu/Phe/Val dehydrogenase [Candidatus Anaeroferrophillus wilburensis]MBN2887797.1 Glu/Leu/Phe/Val dehydrogenase [Deltaproteobacteria bacterium]
MSEMFRFADELGPEKIIHVYQPALGLKAVLVVDNTAAGPALGGIRMAPDVSTVECFRLARAMTFKNAAAGLPHGGGKMVVFADPKMEPAAKEQLMRALACSLKEEKDYIFAPDMGTEEQCMAWVKGEMDRVVALPKELGGIPLDEIGATGWGLSHAAEIAAGFCQLPLAGARLVVQGFGAVGKHVARFLAEKGAVLVGVADSRGALYSSKGLDVAALLCLKESGASVIDYPAGEKRERDAVVGFASDIWIPAARPDVVHELNVAQLQARLVVQGANIPFSSGAEAILHQRGIMCVPDFIANAGGVICAAMEYRGAGEHAALEAIREKVSANTHQVLEEACRKGCQPREAAAAMALRRVKKAMSYRRWHRQES